jgi:hypothetical protein
MENSTGTSSGARQAFMILRFGFTVAPILAGLDRFFDLMVDWDKYLSPMTSNALSGHGHQFMIGGRGRGSHRWNWSGA